MTVTWRKALFSSLLGFAFFGIPVGVLSAILSPEGPIWVVLVYGAVMQILYGIETLASEPRTARAVVVTRRLLIFLGAVLVLINIVIVPNSAYFTWFRLVEEGNARGIVSFVFVMTAGFVAAMLGGQIFRRGIPIPLVGLAMLGFAIGTIITRDHLYLLGLVGSGFLGTLLLGSEGLDWLHRLRFSLGLLLFVATVLGISAAASAVFQSRGSRFVDSVASPGLRNLLLRTAPGFPLLYAIPGYGYSFDTSPLGSSPVLSGSKIFRVHAQEGATVYLRTAAYDTYVDGQWGDSAAALKAAREDGARMMDRLFTPGLVRPSGRDVAVTILGDFYSYLPHMLGIRALGIRLSPERARREGVTPDSAARRALAVQYGSLDTGFLLSSPLIQGDTIILRQGNEPPVPDAGIPEATYLEVPKSVPQDVRMIAEQLGPALHVPFGTAVQQEPDSADSGEIVRMAQRIRFFIQSRTTYSLDTRTPPDGVDLVEYFLFRHRVGYCVHYATAFAILARLEGIPTRYATGFLVNMPYDRNVRDVSGLTAHAWPEIWLPGKGWTAFEVTPPVQAGNFGDPGYYESLPYNARLQRQLRALVGDRVSIDRGSGPGQSEGPTGRFPWMPVVIIVLAGGLLVLIVPRIRRYTGSPAEQLRYASSRIASNAEHLGVPPPTTIGWTAWGEAVSGSAFLRRVRRPVVRRLVAIAHRSFFGGEAVRERDVRFVRLLNRRIPGSRWSRSSSRRTRRPRVG